MRYISFPALVSGLLVSFLFAQCRGILGGPVCPDGPSNEDPHSYAQRKEAVVTHLDLDLKVDFQSKVLAGYARWKIENQGSDRIVFDTDNLKIERVELEDSHGHTESAAFTTGKKDAILGQPLAVSIHPNTQYVRIHYQTSPQAAALLWLDAQQTMGKQMPFVFTQGQAILTRSWIPCQDSPGIRFTYTADLQVPPGMLALMSADNPKVKNALGKYHFEMRQPIPAYLVAMSAGDLVFEEIGNRLGVYAEPDLAEAAMIEFNTVVGMMQAAENLFGPYQWGRYDILVMPPSFPFGGMENPKLSFVNPALITGDRSLTATVAHELAHAWSGNLVTNATWNDFWLNEGMTNYFERRIMEEVEGKDFSDMLTVVGAKDLEKAINKFGNEDPLTCLKLNLTGKNPDDAMSDIAYEKGSFFMLLLEQKVGRVKMDAFLKSYFEEFKFRTVDTEIFQGYLKEKLLTSDQAEIDLQKWLYQPGLPDDCPKAISAQFQKVDSVLAKIGPWSSPTRQMLSDWTPQMFMYFVRNLPRDLDSRSMKSLDLNFKLSGSGNAEIQSSWFALTIYNGYSEDILPQIEAFLMKYGRRRFVQPVYEAFISRGQSHIAQAFYKKARPNYHAITRDPLDQLLSWKE